MKPNNLNSELVRLYTNALKQFTLPEGCSNPFLIKVSEKYLMSEHRIMFFGRETNTWYQNSMCDIDTLMTNYENLLEDVTTFNAMQKSQFLKFMTQISSNSKCTPLWNNILKFGKIDSIGTPPKNIILFNESNFTPIADEIKITQPDKIIFAFGSKYDQFIKNNIGEFTISKFSTEPPDEIAIITLSNFPNIQILRIEHPRSIQKKGIWNTRIDQVLQFIQN